MNSQTTPPTGGASFRSDGDELWALVASTRPMQLPGDDFTTVIPRSTLHDMADQVATNTVWCLVEHLSFLPPFGVWQRAAVLESEDGEAELHAFGRKLPHHIADETPNFDDLLSRLPTSISPPLSVELTYDRRNFDRTTGTLIEQESGGIASPVERRSLLPALAFCLFIAVTWGAKRFLGSFLDELGKQTARTLPDHLKSWAKKSKEPNRLMVLEIEFSLPDGASIKGFVFAEPGTIEPTVEAALQAAEKLAALAGLQNEHGLLHGMKQAAFFFDDGRWQLGWWTDGARVNLTSWFRDNPPPVDWVLG